MQIYSSHVLYFILGRDFQKGTLSLIMQTAEPIYKYISFDTT